MAFACAAIREKGLPGVLLSGFFLSLCLLFWWLGTDSLSWKRMGIPLLFAAGYFWKTKPALPTVSRTVLLAAALPVLVALYTMVSPGSWWLDLRGGVEMLLVYLVGVSSVLMLREKASMAMLCLPFALSLVFLGHEVGFFSKVMVTEDARLSLYMPHPNVLGSVAAWAVLLLVAYRRQWQGMWRFAALGTGGLALIILLMTVSRSAYLALAVGLCWLLFPLLQRHVFKTSAFVVLACLLAVAFVPKNQMERLQSALSAPFSDRTLETRKPIWVVTCAGIARSPIWGNAIDRFMPFHRAYVREHGEELRQRYAEVEPEICDPHNFFLGLLFMYGIVGTTLFLAMTVGALRLGWLYHDPFLSTAFLFYVVFGLFEFPLDREEGVMMLFFPLGMAVGRALCGVPRRTGCDGRK